MKAKELIDELMHEIMAVSSEPEYDPEVVFLLDDGVEGAEFKELSYSLLMGPAILSKDYEDIRKGKFKLMNNKITILLEPASVRAEDG